MKRLNFGERAKKGLHVYPNRVSTNASTNTIRDKHTAPRRTENNHVWVVIKGANKMCIVHGSTRNCELYIFKIVITKADTKRAHMILI